MVYAEFESRHPLFQPTDHAMNIIQTLVAHPYIVSMIFGVLTLVGIFVIDVLSNGWKAIRYSLEIMNEYRGSAVLLVFGCYGIGWMLYGVLCSILILWSRFHG